MTCVVDEVRSGCNGIPKQKIIRIINRCNGQTYLLVVNFSLQLRIPYKDLLFTVDSISTLVVNNDKLYSKL